jgi:hypothetical protein
MQEIIKKYNSLSFNLIKFKLKTVLQIQNVTYIKDFKKYIFKNIF